MILGTTSCTADVEGELLLTATISNVGGIDHVDLSTDQTEAGNMVSS